MAESYPIPSYAASFWTAGDDLFIAFPSLEREGRGHTIRMPATPAGFKHAISIMQERASASRHRLGDRGTPTQYEIEIDGRYKAFNRAIAESKTATATERASAEAELRELGL